MSKMCFSKQRVLIITIIILLVAVIALILTLDSPSNAKYFVSNTRVEQEIEGTGVDSTVRDNAITFNGYVKATVDKKDPYIKLENPKTNEVDFQFIVRDAQSDEVIVNTNTVSPGKYEDINLYDYFGNPGEYKIIVTTFTYDMESGISLDGIDQEVKVVVQ